jgi:hypothetical protein
MIKLRQSRYKRLTWPAVSVGGNGMASGISRSILACIFSFASCGAFAQGVGSFRGGMVAPLHSTPNPAGVTGLATPAARLAAPVPAAPGLAAPTLGSLPGGTAPYGAAGSGASGPQQRATTVQEAIAEMQADLDRSRGDDIYSLPVVEKFRRAGGQ